MSGNGITLLVDAGNSRVKFGWMRSDSDKRASDTLALPHDALNDAVQWLSSLPGTPTAAIGVSVAHAQIAAEIEQITLAYSRVTLQWLGSTASAAGVVNLYEQPERLGNDRWVALLGLSQYTDAVAMLASFGTATTVDTLGPASKTPPQRAFEGGLILPGLELMRQSLVQGTAGLPYAQWQNADFPRNTNSAISTGIAAAQAGAVLRQWRIAMGRLGQPPRLYCTGGSWPLVADEVQAGLQRLQDDLNLPRQEAEWLEAPVLDGLAVLAAAPPC